MFVTTRNYAYELDLTGWGWIHLIVGVVITLAGGALFQGATWARVVGVAVAGLAMLAMADQLTALAAALREGGDAELELGPGTLSLQVPEDLRSEIEVEIGNGEIELEIELKWPTATPRTEPSRTAAGTEEATTRKSGPAEPGQSSTGPGSRSGKRSATKTS